MGWGAWAIVDFFLLLGFLSWRGVFPESSSSFWGTADSSASFFHDLLKELAENGNGLKHVVDGPMEGISHESTFFGLKTKMTSLSDGWIDFTTEILDLKLEMFIPDFFHEIFHFNHAIGEFIMLNYWVVLVEIDDLIVVDF